MLTKAILNFELKKIFRIYGGGGVNLLLPPLHLALRKSCSYCVCKENYAYLGNLPSAELCVIFKLVKIVKRVRNSGPTWLTSAGDTRCPAKL